MDDWNEDILGEGYRQRTIPLGADPDGEGEVEAVLVQRTPRPGEQANAAVLYVHGFSDYFFQTDVADFFAARGLRFFALDLRKCGRARRPGQTAHYVSDLDLYDTDLDTAVATIVDEAAGVPVVVVAHSTGGLVTPLWLDRRRQRGQVAPVVALVLNSPWFDLQGPLWRRTLLPRVLPILARLKPFAVVPGPKEDLYTLSIHESGTGEWAFDPELKPIAGAAVTIGWIAAVLRAQHQLHRGLDVGVPTLVLRSDRSHFARVHSPEGDRADMVLDVQHMARWAGSLGDDVTLVTVHGARHDVFLSLEEPRRDAFAAVERWLAGRDLAPRS